LEILIVAAHPDDELLGAGGTIPVLARQNDVHIAILGEGISSRYNQRQKAKRKELQKLQQCARYAAKILGAKSVMFGGLPDNRFDEVALLDIIKQIEKWVDEFKPHIIYTHHAGDLNIDHMITFRAVLTATRPLRGCPVKEIYAFEIPSSTEWAFTQFEPPFTPNVFVDISTTIETKIQAMQAYESERREFPHPRSPEAIRTIAQRWGIVVGLEATEVFQLVRSIR
jgi:LmbE family N-acetylglucosaminyl deacetylase